LGQWIIHHTQHRSFALHSLVEYEKVIQQISNTDIRDFSKKYFKPLHTTYV
jgi:predicted Zn-dependent peptidase